jgi:pimeloyl-ACP methyl ester carboxylesterase
MGYTAQAPAFDIADTVLTARGDVAAAIGANPAPSLLVGGTDDRLWVPDAARASGKQVLEIPGADHWLRVPGPVRHYAEVLGMVGTAMEEFLDALAGDAGGAR